MLWFKKHLHLLLFLCGAGILSIPIFHTHLWFDEAFSVAMAQQSTSAILHYAALDVHPPFYYLCLRLIYCLTNSILALRLFSYICVLLASAFGFLLAKHENQQVGLWYTIGMLFLPVFMMYAGEIRMYSLALFLASGCLYFLLRMMRKMTHFRFACFAIFSIGLAYTHYYGLLIVALLNLYAFWLAVKQKQWLMWFVFAGAQLGCYSFQFPILFSQWQAVHQNFWIELIFPDTYIEMILFLFSGGLKGNQILPSIIGLIGLGWMIFIYWKHLEQPVILCLGVSLFVILIGFGFSLYFDRPIIYARYLLLIEPFLVYGLACQMVQHPLRIQKYSFLFLGIMSFVTCLCLSMIHYDSRNEDVLQYLRRELHPTDLIIVSNDLQDPNSFIPLVYFNQQVIYDNENHWDAHSILAYHIFRQDMQVIDDLSTLNVQQRRVFVISANDNGVKEQAHPYLRIMDHLNYRLINKKLFHTPYKNIDYTITTLQK